MITGVLYTLYTAGFPDILPAIEVMFAEDIARWRIRLNSEKSTNVTFTFQPRSYHPVCLASEIILYKSSVKYLGVHLDEA